MGKKYYLKIFLMYVWEKTLEMCMWFTNKCIDRKTPTEDCIAEKLKENKNTAKNNNNNNIITRRKTKSEEIRARKKANKKDR
mgnify:CR=1 FL=1